MKKLLILSLMIAVLITGCSWMDGEYHSVTPHAGGNTQQAHEGVFVSSYLQLREALIDVIANGTQEATFYIMELNTEMVDQYMNTAITYVTQNTALGAYALKEISYESGTLGEYPAIAVKLDYAHGRQEILRVKNAKTMSEAQNLIAASLRNCDDNLVIKIGQYQPMDTVQYVQDYVNENPHLCMEMPQVAAAVYPESGTERILEISFTYQTSREALRTMQDNVALIFSAANIYVQGSDDPAQRYDQLFSFLMERFDYQIETSITPSYSLLRYGVGDSKAFASVYKVMCQNAQIPCEVVSGTRNGEAWHWNLILMDGIYYHVDLLASSQAGELVLMPSSEMDGYVWEYSEFP